MGVARVACSCGPAFASKCSTMKPCTGFFTLSSPSFLFIYLFSYYFHLFSSFTFVPVYGHNLLRMNWGSYMYILIVRGMTQCGTEAHLKMFKAAKARI